MYTLLLTLPERCARADCVPLLLQVAEDELHEMLRKNPGMRIVDVREESEVAAMPVPVGDINEAKVTNRSTCWSCHEQPPQPC